MHNNARTHSCCLQLKRAASLLCAVHIVMYESRRMIRIQMKRACARVHVCFHWRPLHVQLHSSFRQSTMGNCEPLLHLAVLVCFVAQSWCVCFTFSFPQYVCVCVFVLIDSISAALTLFSLLLLWWQSTPKSNYITSLMHFQHEAMFFSSSSSTSCSLGWKSPEDRRFTLRRLSCVTSWYLGQWCLVMLRYHTYWEDVKWILRSTKTLNCGLGGAIKDQDAQVFAGLNPCARTGWEHLSSESGWLILLPPIHSPPFSLCPLTFTHTYTSLHKTAAGFPSSVMLKKEKKNHLITSL